MNDQRLLETARHLATALSPADLDATLSQLTAAAVEVLPEVDMCSMTILRPDGALVTAAPTDQVLLHIDQQQYELREGPCYDAATHEDQVVSSDLASDERFPRYAAVAVAEGVRSQIGVRLFDGRAHGALNLYSRRAGAFEDVGSVSRLFAHQAALAIGYAQEIGNLAEAVRTRTVIGQAVGIVMERYSLDDQRAFAFLQRLSSHRNVKLRMIAQELVDGAQQGAQQG